ncbi:mitochondrial sodium/calcium exchanger protein-like [Centruroides vittatus]|uniref:mitochondrial sodium/calcium exchanger protein-like n=1 Tax=Centruroides vittatus TaxID=120091 RepID=UPI003510C12D
MYNETISSLMNTTVSTLYLNTTKSHEPLCRDVNGINGSQRCNFVRTTLDCRSTIGYIDYTAYMYCSFGDEGATIAVGLSVLWLLLLFIGLGMTANDFLCPALFVISKTLKMSQNVAGVTLLAFGNGSPDIFSAIAGIQQGKTDLVIGGLIGGGIFVTTVVAGSIFLIKSFTIMKRPFLRDIFFYIGATSWVFYLCYTGSIFVYHAIGLVILYVVYIIVVMVSRYIHQKYQENPSKEKEASAQEKSSTLAPVASFSSINFGKTKREDDPEAAGVVLTSFFFLNDFWDNPQPSQPISPEQESGIFVITTPPEIAGRRPTCGSISVDIESLEKTSSETSLVSSKKKVKIPVDGEVDPLKDFLYQICPINVRGWSKLIWWQRVLEICKCPVMLLLTITTPVLDVTKPKQNWCRYLNVLHCITGPLFILMVTGYALTMIGGKFPLICVILVISLILAAVVFFTSENDKQPKYHCAFSYLGFLVAVVWIYCIANEIVVLLQAVGIVFNLSDTILGLTILAWGNCLLDFLSNVAVARKGFPRMGIAACFGAPFLTLLLGVGVSSMIRLFKSNDGELTLMFTRMTIILFATLATSLIITLITMTILRFRVRRYYGVFLIIVYLTFLITAVLTEVGIF